LLMQKLVDERGHRSPAASVGASSSRPTLSLQG
jgi:hypothetical protein